MVTMIAGCRGGPANARHEQSSCAPMIARQPASTTVAPGQPESSTAPVRAAEPTALDDAPASPTPVEAAPEAVAIDADAIATAQDDAVLDLISMEMGAADEFHPENYRDEVADRIKAQIQKKIEGGEEIQAEAEQPRAQVIDLMEALKASLASPKAKKSPSRIPIKAETERKPAKTAPRKIASARSRAR